MIQAWLLKWCSILRGGIQEKKEVWVPKKNTVLKPTMKQYWNKSVQVYTKYLQATWGFWVLLSLCLWYDYHAHAAVKYGILGDPEILSVYITKAPGPGSLMLLRRGKKVRWGGLGAEECNWCITVKEFKIRLILVHTPLPRFQQACSVLFKDAKQWKVDWVNGCLLPGFNTTHLRIKFAWGLDLLCCSWGMCKSDGAVQYVSFIDRDFPFFTWFLVCHPPLPAEHCLQLFTWLCAGAFLSLAMSTLCSATVLTGNALKCIHQTDAHGWSNKRSDLIWPSGSSSLHLTWTVRDLSEMSQIHHE